MKCVKCSAWSLPPGDQHMFRLSLNQERGGGVYQNIPTYQCSVNMNSHPKATTTDYNFASQTEMTLHLSPYLQLQQPHRPQNWSPFP